MPIASIGGSPRRVVVAFIYVFRPAVCVAPPGVAAFPDDASSGAAVSRCRRPWLPKKARLPRFHCRRAAFRGHLLPEHLSVEALGHGSVIDADPPIWNPKRGQLDPPHWGDLWTTCVATIFGRAFEPIAAILGRTFEPIFGPTFERFLVEHRVG